MYLNISFDNLGRTVIIFFRSVISVPENVVVFEEEGNVLVVDVTAWNGDPAQIQGSEQEFLDIVASNEYDGVVTDMGDVKLSAETQRHIKESWTELIAQTGLSRFAYVSQGLGAMATNANIQTDGGVERKSFKNRSEAVGWAGGA